MTGHAFTPMPAQGRRYRVTGRPVRLGDVSPRGRMRLDAIARWLQDVANDDVTDAGLGGGATAWVVRRTVLETPVPITFGERVELTTWCSGTGARWAERRTTLAGSDGGFAEAVSLWIHVDLASGAPARLDPRFDAVYGEAAGGRRVRPGLDHDDLDPAATGELVAMRFADFDVMGHVNNAVYWALAEDLLSGRGWAGRVRGVLEYRAGVGIGDAVRLSTVDGPPLRAWWTVDGDVRATAVLEPLSTVLPDERTGV